MSSIKIEGENELYGKIKVQGSKNAMLPIMAATLLCGGISVLKNYPDIEDVRQMRILLESIGCLITTEDDVMIIDSQPAKDIDLPEKLTGKLRASSVLLGPMLARFHHVKMAQPGGCRIGNRPLDIHMNIFKAFGASWAMSDSFIEVECNKLHPAQVKLQKKSVGATENAIMTASLIKGESRIANASIEPEIIALCEYLKNTGVKIQIYDKDTITVEGRECTHAYIEIPGDRIVAGTYMGAVTACKGKIEITGINVTECRGFLNIFTGMGMKMESCGTDFCVVSMNKRPLAINNIQTGPYPEFPTDMQSIVMSCLSRAEGVSTIIENVFDNRLGVAGQLNCMGADIAVDGRKARIRGVDRLSGACVKAQDLRGAAALVIAGMSAVGMTEVDNVEYLNRGYYKLYENMNKLGAKIYG